MLVGFAGAAADGFTLVERLESRLEAYGGQLLRAAYELARDWRTDRVLRRLEALLIAADRRQTLLLSGNGDYRARRRPGRGGGPAAPSPWRLPGR